LRMTRAIPRWLSALLLVGVWLLGWPDGEEIFALCGSVLLAVAIVPYGVRVALKRVGNNWR